MNIEKKQKILTFVRDNPRCSSKDLGEYLGLPSKTTCKSLLVLKRQGMIHVAGKQGRGTHAFNLYSTRPAGVPVSGFGWGVM